MTQMNPNAVLFIAMGGIVGYLSYETKGCLYGLLITMIFVFFVSIVGRSK